MQVIFAADEAPITAHIGYRNSAPNYIQQTQTMPNAGPTYIQQAQPAPHGQDAAIAAASWQSYTPYSAQQQENADPAASSCQKPSQSGWQLNSGPQNWSAQSQAQSSNWQGSSYQSSNAQQSYWSASQYSYGGKYKQNAQQ
eukprot:1912631-Amphidinium_carterae.1